MATAAALQVPFQVLRILNLQSPENLKSPRSATGGYTGVHSSRSGRPEIRSSEPDMCAQTMVFVVNGRSGRPEIRSSEPEMCAQTMVFVVNGRSSRPEIRSGEPELRKNHGFCRALLRHSVGVCPHVTGW